MLSLTSAKNFLNSKNKIVQAKIISKQNGIISGINFCKAAFKLLERKSKFLQKIKDGKKVKRNQIIAIKMTLSATFFAKPIS